MRRRMILVLSLTLLGMLLILTATTRFILMDSFSDLEHRYIEKDVERAVNAIQADLAAMNATANDWAAWDETYAFAASVDRRYMEANLTDGVFANLRLNLMLFIDTKGKLIYGKAYDLGGQREAPLPADLADTLSRYREFLHDEQGVGVTGIMHLPEGHLLAVSRAITDNTATAPRRGSLIMGRFLDAAVVRSLEEQLNLSLTILSPDDPAAPPDIREAPDRLASAGPILVAPLGRSTMAGYALLPDADGSHGMILRVDDPREIAAQGTRSLLYLVGSLLLIAVVFGAVVILYVERSILSRIIGLSRGVLSLGAGAQPGRRVSVEGRDQIAYLGAAINGMLDALEKSTRRSDAFLDAIPDTIFRIDREGNIIDARSPTRLPLIEAADALVGQGTEEILQLYPFISPQRLEQTVEATARALETGAVQSMEFDVELDGVRRSFEERIVASGDNEAVALVRDVTASRQAAEAQRKEILLREIHHRVKNNLQVISSLLALQAGTAGDPQTRSLLRESQDRIRSMALIHEKLYQTGAERGITFAEYARDLAAHLRHSYAGDSGQVEVDVEVVELALDMDLSVPCGLIINELLSNALKHAFPGGRKGRVRLGLRQGEAGTLVLSVSDDGIGFPPGIDVRSPRTLGLRIVNILAAQIRASLALEPGAGTTISLTFPAA